MKKVISSFLKKVKSLPLAAKIVIPIITVVFIGCSATAIVIASNPNLQEEIGRFIRQESVQEITETEKIAFEEKEEQDDTKEEGITETKQEGVEGEKTIWYRIVIDKDGKEISREKLGEEITKEPVEKIVIIGTKPKEEPEAVSDSRIIAVSQDSSNYEANEQNEIQRQNLRAKCKEWIDGPGYGSSGFPPCSRTDFTELGGWEKYLKRLYENPIFPNEDTTGAGLPCFSYITFDRKTLTVTEAYWDGDSAKVCGSYKNEHPPVPSLEYLTNYLRSIAR